MRPIDFIFAFALAGWLLAVSAGCGREQDAAPEASVQTDPILQSERPATATGDLTIASAPPDNQSTPADRSQAAADGSPPPDVAALNAAGRQALRDGQSDQAYDYARQAMRLDGDDPQAIFLMAMVLAERRRYPEAIEMLQEVAETTPQARLPAMGQTADWLVRFGEWDKAEARYREILQQAPGAVLVHRNLARLLLRQGRRLDARAHLDQLCHLGDVTESELRSMLAIAHPLAGGGDSEPEPIGRLGTARTEIARGNWQAVRDRLRPADSSNSSRLGPWESALLGRAYAALEDFDSLRAWVAEADESVNRSSDAWYAKGVLAASAGRQADAIRCFAETVRLDFTDRDAYARLAASLAAAGAGKQADAARRRAELIERTQKLGAQPAGSVDRDQQRFLKLSEHLRQLQRPLEALGWRGVWLTYANASQSISDSELQTALDEIVRERNELLREEGTRAPTGFVLCGLDLDPLPSLNEVNRRLKSAEL